ncbi:MAG: gas vesicle protein GvpG [Planctomycetes bacterium]|nr:gas vesicle protein GvpG [Planctomycetota bacterium]
MAFLIDDLFLLPFKSICQGVKEAAEQDLENQANEAMASLTQLHLQLESQEISEGEFDERETALLLRLENIQTILHPEPKLTKRERLEKHFPEAFEEEPSESPAQSKRRPADSWGTRFS